MPQMRSGPTSTRNSNPLQIAQQPHRVESALGSFLMLEIGEHVEAAGKMLRDAIDHPLPLFARITWLAESIIDKLAGRDVGSGHGFGFCDTQSSIAGLQQVPCRIGEPGLMPEFKCRRHRSRQHGQKILEQRRIGLQVWWKLEQNGTEFTGNGERLYRREKSRHKIFRAFQPLDVRDDLVRLDAEAEMSRRLLQPVLDGRLF